MQSPTVHINEGSAFSRFMASRWGRVIRVGIGATFVGTGLTLVPPPAGLFVAAFGLLPLATGAFNLCPVAPLWGGHLLGAKYCARTATPTIKEK